MKIIFILKHIFSFYTYTIQVCKKQWSTIFLLILIVRLFYYKKFSGNEIGLHGLHTDAKLKETCFIKFLKRWFYASLVYLKPNASKLSNKNLTRYVENRKVLILSARSTRNLLLIVSKICKVIWRINTFLIVCLIAHN